MSTQDQTAINCRSNERQRRSFSITPARRLIGCAVLAISFGLTDIQCFNEPDGKLFVWNCSCTLTALAAADEKKSESEKKAQEKAREQAKKDQERQKEQAKKDQERQKEQAKKDQERQKEQAKKDQERQKEPAKIDREGQKKLAKQGQEQQKEQAKKALEREFEQSKKALEESGASEKDKQELEKRFERDKKSIEYSNRSSEEKPPATLVEFFKRKFKPRAKKPEDKAQVSRQRTKKSEDKEDEQKQVSQKPNVDEQEQKQAKPANKKSRRIASQNRAPGTSFKRGEILAVNPNARARRAAQKLGFRIISSTQLSGGRGRVVRLIAPPGYDTRRARKLLKREVPTGSFELNKKYQVYHAANGERSREKPGITAKAPSPRGRKARSAKYACEADHCFSRSVLHWKQDLETCSGGVRIGIIDTNIDITHRTFQGQNIRRGKFIPPYKQASSDSHGTAVASILAGSRKSSTPGLVPAAEFFTANIFYADENGQPATDTLTLLKALDWLEAWDVQLVNMSFVGPEDPLIHEALRRMSRKNTVFVAAIGNEGPAAPPRYPAAYPEVIAVTAVNSKLNSYRRANRGPFVDVAAPGVNIWTALPGNREGYQSGTSFAAPHVTALLATIYKGRENERTRDQLMKYLPVQDLGTQGRDKIYGRGLVMAPSDCRGTNRPRREIAWTTKRMPKKEVAKSAVFAPAGRLWEPTISRSRTTAEGSLSLN